VECGHFGAGYIKLELPVFHIGYFKNTQQVLQCICKSCSRVLLEDDDRRAFLRRFRSPKLERLARGFLFKKVLEKCKRARLCSSCGAVNGAVK
jgi:DNA-directed RNA polymerase III subunit RPC1